MHHALTLDALRVLQTIDEKGSFAAAAQALYKVPSALTYTVQKLESDLGVSLFDRTGQRAVLTNAGRLLLQEGGDLLRASSRLEERIRQVESGWETRLVIAKDTIIPDKPLLEIIQHFCSLDKQVEVSVIEEALGGGWDALHSERADIAIGLTGELPKGQYDIHQIGELEFVFVVAADHPLADYVGILESQVISQYPAIIVADSSRALPERSAGLFDSKQQIKVHNMQTKVQAQMLGLGTGFLPLHIARPYLERGELIAKATAIPRPPIPVYFASPKGKDGRALAWYCEQIKQKKWL